MTKGVTVINVAQRRENSRRSQKWVALLAAPIFFLIAGTLANAGMEQVSTTFAILAMAMPGVFLVLLLRDWLVGPR